MYTYKYIDIFRKNIYIIHIGTFTCTYIQRYIIAIYIYIYKYAKIFVYAKIHVYIYIYICMLTFVNKVVGCI